MAAPGLPVWRIWGVFGAEVIKREIHQSSICDITKASPAAQMTHLLRIRV